MATVISEINDLNMIDFVAGLSDPGEMIACGYLPQLRRLQGEQDAEYQRRILPLVMALPEEERNIIMGAAQKRAGLHLHNGKIALVYNGAQELAWHKVGTVFNGLMTSDECAAACEALRRTVSKVQLKLPSGADAKGMFAIVYDDAQDDAMGYVGSDYKVAQISECFGLMDGVVGEKLAMYESAGALKGGRIVFMSVRIPGEYRVGNTDDVVQPYTMLTTSHGLGAIKILPTSVRPVCANTHNIAIKGAGRGSVLSIRHTGNIKNKLDEIRTKLGVVTKGFEKHMEKVNVLAGVEWNEAQAGSYFEGLYPTNVDKLLKGRDEEFVSDLLREKAEREAKRNEAVVKQLWENFGAEQNNIPGIEGTPWAAYNSVSQYIDHQKTARGKDDDARDEQRMFNTVLGDGAKVKANAFNAAFQMTQAV